MSSARKTRTARTPRYSRSQSQKPPRSTVQLEIVNRSGRSVPQAFLKRWVALLAREASLAINPARYVNKSLVIAFVSSDNIRELNKMYRGKNKPTDVLSFGSEGEPDSLGELAISPEVISRQAKEHGLLVREELGYMVIHGFLHLLGYDHEKNERDAKRMFNIQDELFERMLEKI